VKKGNLTRIIHPYAFSAGQPGHVSSYLAWIIHENAFYDLSIRKGPAVF
jgi:hypothetical protein